MTTQLVERIAVEVDGQGDPVLLIHGLGGSSNTWTPVMAAFLRAKALRMDLPGSARSHRVEGPLSIERFVQAATRVLSAVGASRVHVVAHSLGTIVAQHLAATQPALVRSLALFGPLFAPPDAARANIRARGEKARSEGVAGMQAIADALVQSATSAETKAKRPTAVAFVRESLMRQDPDGYARTCAALADAQPADPGKIAGPTLLVTGDEDAIAPPQSVRQMGEKLARSRVEVLRGCGHWTPVEKPEECAALLSQFHAQRM
jgi:pimeloyl-ACP methyl ester carboxylesterase